jgi:hypothetical protein
VTSPETADGLVIVRGHATDEEVAAVLASLRHVDSQTSRDRYDHWRATRLAALNQPLSRPMRRDRCRG